MVRGDGISISISWDQPAPCNSHVIELLITYIYIYIYIYVFVSISISKTVSTSIFISTSTHLSINLYKVGSRFERLQKGIPASRKPRAQKMRQQNNCNTDGGDRTRETGLSKPLRSQLGTHWQESLAHLLGVTQGSECRIFWYLPLRCMFA